jgi:glycosyltransferase involved in cell wall biosynthesis
MMRIAHLTTIDASLALLLQTELLIDRDAGAEVIGLSAPGPFVEELEQAGIRHVAIPSLTRAVAPLEDARAAREILSVLRELRPDILHTHTPKPGVLGRVLGRLARVPVIVNTCHGLWATSNDRPLKRMVVYGVEAVAAQFSDFELFQNATDRSTLSWCLRDGRSEIVGNGIDLVHFRYSREERMRVRRELEVGDGELLVGGVGRQVAEKGLLEFVAVAEQLRGQARFVWVGPSDAVKADAVNPLSDAVQFLGVRRDMPAVYSALDLFVLPSHREGFSRSAMEAAACGRAMVLTEIRGCREVAHPDLEAIFVPPKDIDRLNETIHGLLHDAEARASLGAAASQRAHEEFDQRKVAMASLAAYRKVYERKRYPWPLATGRQDEIGWPST